MEAVGQRVGIPTFSWVPVSLTRCRYSLAMKSSSAATSSGEGFATFTPLDRLRTARVLDSRLEGQRDIDRVAGNRIDQ